MGQNCAEISKILSAVYKEISRINECHYLDTNDFVSHYNSIDFMHLDEKGHQQLADALHNKVKEIF